MLDDVKHTFVGRPQEEGMKQCNSKFSLSKKPRLSDPGGVGALQKVVGGAVARSPTWNLHTTQSNYFAPTKQEGCQSSRLAVTKD